MPSDDEHSSLVAGDESDEEFDWEEVDITEPQAEQHNIEITLQARPKHKQDKASDKSVSFWLSGL